MRKLTTDEWIEKAIGVHGDKYDYSKVEYVRSHDKVIIICPLHGEFSQTASNHRYGFGCKECGNLNTIDKLKQLYSSQRDWDFIQPEEYKLIPITQGKFVKVSNEDFERLKGINWQVMSKGYVKNDTVGLMHRYIMNAPPELHVDHINHDTLDNRKSNLRLATRPQNMANQRSRKVTSIYKGVSWDKERNKWRSVIGARENYLMIGRYDSEEEAGMAYDRKALELFGDFAYLNFPELKEKYLKELGI